MQEFPPINRRAALAQLGAAAAIALPAQRLAAQAESSAAAGMGLVTYSCRFRRQWLAQREPQFDLFEPLTFLKHCHSLGAGGMQAELGSMTPEQIGHLREYAERHRLFLDAIVAPPRDERDLPRFEAEIKTARDLAVQAARTVIMPGRRYERFRSLAEFREFEQRGRRMLELAVPIVEKHRVRLAVENHKDQRIDERVALYQQWSSEYLGACVDTGNSFALLDDPYAAVEALAPYAFTVHLKDQALQPYDEGFLLGDIPLGQGSFDLARMVAILRQAKSGIRFVLELITRDPLQVPCLSDDYWATLMQVPARDLARAMRFVREHRAPLQQVSSLSFEKQVQLEDSNVLASLTYARDRLGL